MLISGTALGVLLTLYLSHESKALFVKNMKCYNKNRACTHVSNYNGDDNYVDIFYYINHNNNKY